MLRLSANAQKIDIDPILILQLPTLLCFVGFVESFLHLLWVFFFITKQQDIIISSLNFKQCSAFEKNIIKIPKDIIGVWSGRSSERLC